MGGKGSWDKILKITVLEMKIKNRINHLAILIPFAALLLYFMFYKKDIQSMYLLPNISTMMFIYFFTAMFADSNNEIVLYRIIPVSTREFVIGKNIGNFLVFFLSSLLLVVIVGTASGKSAANVAISASFLLYLYIAVLVAGNLSSILAIKRGIRERFFLGAIIVSSVVIVSAALFMIAEEFFGFPLAFTICFISNVIIYLISLRNTINNLKEIAGDMQEGIWMQ